MFLAAIGLDLVFLAGLAQAQDTSIFINVNNLTMDVAFSNARAMPIAASRIVVIGSKVDVITATGSGASRVNLKGNKIQNK